MNQSTQDYAEQELLKNLKIWYANSVTILNQLAGLPISNSSASTMADLISGFNDLQPDFKSIEENFQFEREAMAEALKSPRRD